MWPLFSCAPPTTFVATNSRDWSRIWIPYSVDTSVLSGSVVGCGRRPSRYGCRASYTTAAVHRLGQHRGLCTLAGNRHGIAWSGAWLPYPCGCVLGSSKPAAHRAVRGITSALYRPWPESLAGVEEPALLAPRPSVCAQTTQMRERGLCRWVRLLLCRHALRG